MTPDKALGLLSLARKAGKIELGEEPVGAVAKLGKARLIVLAQDASDNARRRVAHWTDGTKQPVLTLPYDKQTLGGALGWSATAMAAFTDTAMAAALVKTLAPTEEHAALLAALEAQAARFKKRAGTKKHKKSS